jgi:nucleoid-associated protein YgaU
MGFFDFMKDAGEKIFKPGEDRQEKAIETHLRGLGLDVGGVKVEVEGSTATLSGHVQDQATREKVVLSAGNVAGIARVDDRLTVLRSAAVTPSAGAAPTAPAPGVTVAQESQGSNTGWSSRTYTVQKGDTLSGIAKEMYGDAGKYQQIFQANQPMLKDPDRIYPGQVLRIPAES